MLLAILDIAFGSAGEWAAAMATLAAVVVALFGPEWSSKKKRPKLTLGHFTSPDGGHLRTAEFNIFGGGVTNSHWVQMEVRNERGRHTAQDVHVQLISVGKLGNPPEMKLNLEVAQFRWSNTEGEAALKPVSLAPGFERKIDVVALVGQPGRTTPPGQWPHVLFLQAEPRPSGDRDHLPAGGYRFLVAITAKDLDVVKYQFDLHFDGKWWESPEVWNHLRATEPVVAT